MKSLGVGEILMVNVVVEVLELFQPSLKAVVKDVLTETQFLGHLILNFSSTLALMARRAL